MRRIINILLLLLLVQTFTFAQGVGVDSVQVVNVLADSVADNTIKDTIVLKYSRGIVPFETIAREGTKYYAVTSDGHKEEITSFINGRKHVMVKDGDGHELVIDKDGNVMGVEEYKKCGGSKALLRESIKEKDSQVTKSGNVKFFSTGDYLFDTYDNYSGKTGYAEHFPSIGEGDYRPAYACVESKTKLEIKAEPYKTYTFKNERGVPVLCKDGILEVTARGDRDTTSIYAYDAENHIVGKVNVLSYDKVTRKICLVPIGDTKATDAVETKQGLDEIFAKLMVDFDVTIGEPIKIQYAKNNIFTHGGSGMIGVYNTDQKVAINKLKERGIDNETVYLFFVNDCKALKANDSPDVVNGYMPRGYQFGFIYNELNNYRTIAHEICHGAFHLKHTFDATDYLAAERTTDNLMDYNDGEVLNHWQWRDVHQPKSVRFKWLQEEEEAEAWSEGTRYKCISTELATKIKSKYRYFYYPDGSIVDMKDYLPSGFYLSNDVDAKTSYGAVATIREGDRDLYYSYSKQSHVNRGYGYLLDGSARLKYELPSISADKASELHPVRIRLTDGKVTIIDFMGNELEAYDEQMCNCQMARYTFSSEFEPLVVDENKEYWFYDKKENKIIIVTKVHDLSWLKAKGSVTYDEIKEFAPGEIRMTEAQLADSKYNWLRNDVIKAMNDGGKVVMVGMAATALAPYLIEYVAVYGEQALVQLVRKMGEKAIKDFASGAVVGGVSYVAGQMIFEQEIKTADIIYHSVMGGISNLSGKKLAKVSISCADGMDFSDFYSCIVKLAGNDEADCPYVKMLIECGTSVILGEVMSSAKFKENIAKLNTKAKLILASRRGSLGSSIAELRIYEKLAGIKQADWATKRIATIEKYGDKGFGLLKDANFDYSKMSGDNFEILSEFAQSASEESLIKMKELLRSKSASWAIHKLRILKRCQNIDEFTSAIDQIYSKAKDLSVAINGAEVPLQSVLDNIDDYVVRYYYKQEGNYYSFVMQIGENANEWIDFGFFIGELAGNTMKVSLIKLSSLSPKGYLYE